MHTHYFPNVNEISKALHLPILFWLAFHKAHHYRQTITTKNVSYSAIAFDFHEIKSRDFLIINCYCFINISHKLHINFVFKRILPQYSVKASPYMNIFQTQCRQQTANGSLNLTSPLVLSNPATMPNVLTHIPYTLLYMYLLRRR